VQNVCVHESIAAPFIERMTEHVKRIKLGDPIDPKTQVGTLIDEHAAKRVEAWVNEAVAQGAKLLAGGTRHGAAYEPTLLAGVAPTMKVVCEEVFGPVATVQTFTDLEPLYARINEGQYGLHVGIFTKSLPVAFEAIRRLRVGGVIVNGTSTWRTDQLAYGGIKASGIGREGPKFSIRDMTEERLVVFNL
jgi:acyl-CoA reductase-like NAD-dependent aldehyde dehydrogenase